MCHGFTCTYKCCCLQAASINKIFSIFLPCGQKYDYCDLILNPPLTVDLKMCWWLCNHFILLLFIHTVHPEFKCLYRNHNPNCAFPAWTHMKSKKEIKHSVFLFFPWKIIIPKCFCMWRPCRLTHTQNYINNSSRINNPTHTISFKIYPYRFLSYICFVSWSVAVTLTAWLSVEVVIQ